MPGKTGCERVIEPTSQEEAGRELRWVGVTGSASLWRDVSRRRSKVTPDMVMSVPCSRSGGCCFRSKSTLISR